MDAPRTNDAAYDAAVKYAADLGAEHGRNAASWYFDGNTTAQTYARVLRGIEEGDPEILDSLPFPDLSGEWADGLTGPELFTDAMRAADMTHDYPATDRPDWFSDVCDAYESAFEQGVADTIETAARAMVESEVEE